jgi:hypothetical protein
MSKVPTFYNGLVSKRAKKMTLYNKNKIKQNTVVNTNNNQTATVTLDVYVPKNFNTILSSSIPTSISTPTVTVTSLTNRNRYMIKTNNTYINISDTYSVSFSTTLSTYKTFLTKVFEFFQDSSDSTCFRIDSELHSLYSLDYNSSTGKLVFTNNWGNGGTRGLSSGNGYLCFKYTTDKKLQVIKRYAYSNTEYTHSLDNSFSYANYYVKYSSSGLSLVSTSSAGSTFLIYNSKMNVTIPSNFNPEPTSYVPNDAVSIKNYISNTRTNIEGTTLTDPNCKFIPYFYNNDGSNKVSDAGYQYANQIKTRGYDASNNGTNYYANLMLTEISSKVATNTTYKTLRYPTSIYKVFREGALSIVLKGNTIANGDIGMNTTPYVYFTCEKNDSNQYHPFMCIVSYSIADKPIRLWDICKPPGDGGDGGYPAQEVTRHATLQLYLTKIPMLDYGLVNDISGSVSYTGGAMNETNSNTNNMHSANLAYDFIENYTENGNSSKDGSGNDVRIITTLNYNNYNYTAISGIGITIDGVALYPVLNNTLTTAPKSAEITNTGIHVGQGMGLHYHADGYSARSSSTNQLCLYNDMDYTTSRKHPPLIGFGLDGIALYGIYTSNYTTMDGYSVALDSFGGHSHGLYGYHYHSHTVQNSSSNNVDTITDGSSPITYKIYILMKGAWKGKVGDIPDFWDSDHGSHHQYAPQYSLSTHSKYVWGYDTTPP